MPTLFEKNGFKFFFYANDHEPPHVHVMKGDDYCRVELKTLEVADNHMKPVDLKKVLDIIKENKNEFERKWYVFFYKR